MLSSPTAGASAHVMTPAVRGLSDDAVPLVMFAVAIVAGIFLTPAQNDTWWHLHSGRVMWETRAFLTTEQFSFASGGQPLQNHWWLTQVLFFGIFSLGGPLLLASFAGACAAAAIYMSFRLTRGTSELRLLMLVALVLCTAPEWSVRPQVLSLALMMVMTTCIARGGLAWLPLLCLIWGNAHAMVVFGIVLAGAAGLEAIVWSRAQLRKVTVITLLCVAAPMCSPIGLSYWPRVLATVSTSQALDLQEYRTPLSLVDLPFWLLLIALVGVVIRFRARIPQLARGERTLLIASLVLALAALSAARNVAFFAVLAVPVITALVAHDTRRRTFRPAGWPAYLLLAAEAAAAVWFVSARWQQHGASLGWQPLPAGTVQAVSECEGPMFNTLEDGGPLMWALNGRKVFVDSRMEAYPQPLLAQSRAADLEGRYETLFSEFRMTCAVVPTGSPLDMRLRTDAAFRVTHRDDWRTVFARAVS